MMYYLAAGTRNIKLKQDASDFSPEDPVVIVICDGIGGMDGSDKVASFISENLIPKSVSEDIYPLDQSSLFKELRDKQIPGGTTLIHLRIDSNNVIINYLGNGGITHLQGDYTEKKYAENHYQYTQLLNPHINQNGALLKHISKDSSKEEMDTSKIQLSLNSMNGDIILLYSDGINSLEVNPIIKDDDDRYWRNESQSIHFILDELDKFLKTQSNKDIIQDSLHVFINRTLESLNTQNMLEDDASLGILISDRVIDHYMTKIND